MADPLPTDDDDEPKKPTRATIIRRGLIVALVLACAGGWIYTRWIVTKHDVGEPCTFDLHCRSDAPRCLKQSVDGEGVCTRSCDKDGDCAPGIRCVKVELDEYDERGRPLEGGYCFPQALLDARRKKPTKDAGPPQDSWVAVPETTGQLEGEIVLDRGGARTTWQVKGTLLRSQGPGRHRTIVDTSSLRVYNVDDDKRSFGAAQIAALDADIRVTKTDRKETVADRECEVWQIAEGAKELTACVIRGAAFVDPAARAVSAWEKELAVRGVFPLRVVDKGSEKPRLFATTVDVKPLDAALFAVPKTYKNLAGR